MVCETAEELHARLVLRAMWPTEGKNGQAEAEDEGEAPGVSLLHRRLRAELNEVLEGSFKRRLARIEQKVAILCEGGQADSKPAPVFAPPTRAAAGKPRPSVEAEVQTEEEEPVCTKQLAEAQPPGRAADPKEEKEDLPVAEELAIKSTLETLGRSLSSRAKQISSLEGQLKVCHDILEDRTREADAGAQDLRDLLADPSKLSEAHRQRVQKRTDRVKELSDTLEKTREQAKRYQMLAHQQRAFFLQGERISASGGTEAVARCSAGELAVVQRPPPMGDEKPEVWDIGTAVANPYVVDSWPFEPNVLASRTSKEATMQSCVEETEEDLEEERRRLPFRAGLSLRLPGRRLEEDDEYDDQYGGPSSTSRSM
eukprot:CAMPEP_0175405628 /NCGR_PEP_ID=MMETSP0095-20121207/39149_1 /TAXON_ID=311494 /ORGANISM="Alexandrium monilatum, Strain CCMP3105" /LENGTH=369 /DNA_ID=CAMNT_0016704469 /DNA_START=47 /DNA_END=1157 /DNA_ORIENTATION=+